MGMSQILIRNLDDAVHQKLKAKAAANGQSLEAYLRALLSETAGPTKAEILAGAKAIRNAFRGHPLTEEQHQASIADGKAELEERADRLLSSAERAG